MDLLVRGRLAVSISPPLDFKRDVINSFQYLEIQYLIDSLITFQH